MGTGIRRWISRRRFSLAAARALGVRGERRLDRAARSPHKYLPTLNAELDGHFEARRAQQAAEIGDRALRLARDILDLDEFRDLALPGGLARRGRPEPASAREMRRAGKRRRNGEPPKTPGNVLSARGRRIRYEEVPFEGGSTAHSRFVSGVVQANALHPDFQQAARSATERLAMPP